MGKATCAALACLAFLAAASAVTLDNVAQDSFDFNYQGVEGVRDPSSACRRTLVYTSAHVPSPFPVVQSNYVPARKPHTLLPPATPREHWDSAR